MRTKVALLPITATLLLILGGILLPSKLQALSGSDFNPGRIIDDAIFFNNNTMSPDQIQQFLNAKIPVCDRNHAGFTSSSTGVTYNPPFICLNEYQENPITRESNIGRLNPNGSPYSVPGGKSAAQLIWEVSQAHGINPQVILVMLQKEQGLITDTWPTSNQYKIAMGYACPDTAACDSAYFGFYNQINSAAKQLRRYVNFPDNYNFKVGVTRYIGYNPSSACGGSNVYLQTAATAALYNYTPYQPNAGALANLTDTNPGGTSDCGAYGNRNFFWFFNKWFGSPYGSLFRTHESGSLFYTNGQYRFIVPSMDVAAQYGFSMGDIRYVNQQELNSIPIAGPPYTQSLGQIVKSNSDTDADGGAIYLVSGGRKIPISSLSQLQNLGSVANNIHYLPLISLDRLLTDKPLSDYAQSQNQSLFKLEAGKLRVIYELSKFIQQNPSGTLSKLTDFTLSSWPVGDPLVDGPYVAVDQTGALRLYDQNTFYPIPTIDIFKCAALDSIKLFYVYSFLYTNGTEKNSAGCMVKDSASNTFILNNSQRYQITLSNYANPATLPDSILERLATTSIKPVLKSTSSNEIAVFEGNRVRPLPTMSVFTELGYGPLDITTLNHAAYSTITRGPKKVSTGSLLLEPAGGISVASGETTRLKVSSIDQLIDYGYSSLQLIPMSAFDLAAYTLDGNLTRYIRTSQGVYFIDAGVRYLIPASLETDLSLNRSTLPTLDERLIINSTLHWNMTAFIKSNNDYAVYKLSDGKKHPLASWDTFMRESGGRPQDLITLSPDAVSKAFPIGSIIY